MAILHHRRVSHLTLLIGVLWAFRRKHSLFPRTTVLYISLPILLASLVPEQSVSVDVPQFMVATFPDTFPNTPWGVVSLPNFEKQWVPNPRSHFINVMPGLHCCSQIHTSSTIHLPSWVHLPRFGNGVSWCRTFLFPIQREILRLFPFW